MTSKEAAHFGVPQEQRRAFLRIEDAKVNLSPAGSARWVRTVSVPLGNGADYWPRGDFVGVAEAWTPPKAQSGTGADLARVQAALMASPRPPRADCRSPDWVGWLVARVMGLDVGTPSTPKEDLTPAQMANRARVRAVVADWVRGGWLVERQEPDPDTRKKRRFVHVGQPAVVLDESTAGGPSDADGVDDDERFPARGLGLRQSAAVDWRRLSQTGAGQPIGDRRTHPVHLHAQARCGRDKGRLVRPQVNRPPRQAGVLAPRPNQRISRTAGLGPRPFLGRDRAVLKPRLLAFTIAPRRVRPAVPEASLLPGKGKLSAAPARPQLRPADPRQRSAPDAGFRPFEVAFALGLGLEAGDAGHGGRSWMSQDKAYMG